MSATLAQHDTEDGAQPFTATSSLSSQARSPLTTAPTLEADQNSLHLPDVSRTAQQSGCEAGSCVATFRAEASEPLVSAAQRRWAARPLAERLQTLRKARYWMAAHPEAFAKAISSSLARSQADTLVTELLPLLDAMRFLERNARRILAPCRLGSKHRPLWLTGVAAEIHRDPLGHVLVIGPANFPLFLPGVQALQALVAGNAVTWKPGAGGQRVAVLLAHILREAGLPRGVLHVTEESVEAAQDALAQRPDKVVFTGSVNAGRHILRELADSVTPATMELSGADAVVVLPSADLAIVAKALAFGLRLNGAEVCMSPRRLVATRESLIQLRPLLKAAMAGIPAVSLKSQTAALLRSLTADASANGAEVLGEVNGQAQMPLLVDHARPAMAITRTDIFAPVLSLIEAPSVLHIADLVNDNPYGLTAAIFGNPREAQTLAAELRVGTVVVNDLIAPTADPRIPFGGRGQSGFGCTRGAEGLLEMTTPKTLLLRSKGSTRHYDPLGNSDVSLISGFIGALHGGSLQQRWRALKQLTTAARAKSRVSSN